MQEMKRASRWYWLLISGLAFGACAPDESAQSGPATSGPGVAGSPAVPPTAGVPGTTIPNTPANTPGVGTPGSIPGTGVPGTGVPGQTPGNQPGVGTPGSTPGTTPGTTPVAGGVVPCAQMNALTNNCQKCHGSMIAFGAPMSLVTVDDFHKPAKSDPTKKVYEVALARMNDQANPMPPGGAMDATERKVLTDWLSAGAVGAPATEGMACQPSATGERTVHDAAYFRNGLTPLPGETCYELANHGGQTEGDTTPYAVRTGEHYQQFYFKVPWGADDVMTRYGAKYDNLKVLHHWLLFTSTMAASKVGTSETTIGTTIGDTAQLIAGWAVGGDHVTFPPDTALELTQTGILNLQWHFYNQGTVVEMDKSTVQVCTVKRATKKNIGSLTFLGTENFNGPLGMPAKTESKFSGSCLNDLGAPITLFGFNPHMHKLGTHMNTVILRKSGMMETVFDKAFDFNSQFTYVLDKPIVLEAGESIVSTCTFNNTTDANVAFGPSTEEEMCYNFTMSYPAKALDNGTPSLIGATNTCW
jgi:hypothetical protein